ncbi:M56 family metallopeptidase [Tenacibaculum ascidiaceicola]|uniref:M56 family metallopeptidase n=1 Tax=Tenacibaculum ascidiaceicola TaxID=1699411 RepID=UPI003CE520FC
MEEFSRILLYFFISSLVIGTFLGGVSYILMLFSKKYTSIVRYNILIMVLSLFVISMTYLVFAIIGDVYFEANNVYSMSIERFSIANNLSDNGVNIAGNSFDIWSIFQEGYYKIYNYSFEITLLWYVIFCYKSLRLYLGLRGIKKIIYKSKEEIDTYWNEKATFFAEKIGLKQKIQIYKSSVVNTPMVLGFIKPIVLLPVQLITGMPQAQIEVIIYHELAHIKRYDPIVNLLQNILETVFFFNPPLLWLLSKIRIEREKCCDDLVLEITNNKKDYLKALYSCAELQIESNKLSVAFASENEALLDRVKRIVSKKEHLYTKTQTIFFYMLTTIFLVASVAFTSVSKPSKEIISKEKTENRETFSEEKTVIFTGITSENLTEEEGKNIVETLKGIINKMSEEGLIQDKNELSFLIDKDKLMLNGKQVSSKIHAIYKSIYIKKNDWKICYNYKIKLN